MRDWNLQRPRQAPIPPALGTSDGDLHGAENLGLDAQTHSPTRRLLVTENAPCTPLARMYTMFLSA
jgi:hypothetical protein